MKPAVMEKIWRATMGKTSSNLSQMRILHPMNRGIWQMPIRQKSLQTLR